MHEYKNLILQMQEDVRRALKKPIEQRRWVMVVDLKKCIGCDACTIACKAEYVTPPGVTYNIVMKEEVGTYPNVRQRFIRRPCMQCSNPPCVWVCPVGANHIRPDGIVAISYDKCIGCRYCITACPYGARYFDFGEYYTDNTPELQAYEKRNTDDYEKKWKREKGRSPIGNARKCTFCPHRLHKGMLPACVTTCLGRPTYFGDLNDPKSLVSKLVAERTGFRLKEEMGTEPNVYYLG